MENDDAAYQPYVYNFLFDKNNTYEFVTEQNINYEIRFCPTDYLFNDIAELQYLTFEFIIALVFVPVGQKPELDKRMDFTIATIFLDFYRQQADTVILYICDSSDGKQNARERKFNSWFEKYSENEFEKIKVLLEHPKQTDGMLFSVIIKIGNPYKSQIVERLERLKWEYQFGK